MQNLNILEDLEHQGENKDAWLVLWLRDWNISNWLMSSLISSIILSEIYAVVLSIYPNFMVSLWLSFGVSSVILSSLLTFMSIVSLGLITGAAVYSAHLAYQAMRVLEKSYQPLIQIWSSNTKLYGLILKNLLDDDNFLKITKALKEYPPAKPLHEFLKKDENIESVKKILHLLKKIWAEDSIDASVKTLVISLLSEYVQEENAKQHIDNIWTLIELLQKYEGFNLDLMIKAIQNSSQFGPILAQLENYGSEPDVIQKLCDKPELLPYFNAVNEHLDEQSLSNRASNMRSLYFYVKYDLTNEANREHMLSELPKLADEFDVKPSLFKLIKDKYFATPETFMVIWDKLIHHHHSEWIGALLLHMNQEPYIEFIENPKKLLKILNIFDNLTCESELEIQTLIERINLLSLDANADKVAQILKYFDACQCFNIELVEQVLLKSDLNLSLEILKTYQLHIYDAEQSESVVLEDLQKLLVNNHLLQLHLNSPAENGLSLEENKILVTKNYLHPETRPAEETVQAPEVAVRKKPNFWRKVKKVLHLLPEQNQTATNAQAPTVAESKVESENVASATTSPPSRVETASKESFSQETREAYRRWKLVRFSTLETSPESDTIRPGV
jgi:hypothetical protein